MYYGDLWMYAPALENWTHVFPGGQGAQERAYHVAVSIPSGVMVFGGLEGERVPERCPRAHVLKREDADPRVD